MCWKKRNILFLAVAVAVTRAANQPESISSSEDSEESKKRFSLILGSHTTRCLSVGASAYLVKQYLEELPNVDGVNVEYSTDANSKYSYLITFDGDQLSSGNQDEIRIDQNTCNSNIASSGSFSSKVTTIKNGSNSVACEKNDSPIDSYLVEWTTSTDFGIEEVMKLLVKAEKDILLFGTFTVSHGKYTTTPINVQASALEVKIALMNLPSIGEIEVNAVSHGKSEWLITFTQSIGFPGSFFVDSNNVRDDKFTGAVTSNIVSVINGSLPENYGSHYISANPEACNSITIGAAASVQYLSFFADSINEEEIQTGSYQISLGNDISKCVQFNTSALELEIALLEITHVEVVSVIKEMSNPFSFRYKIIFREGTYPYGEWPILSVPTKHFGSGECDAFNGSQNYRSFVMPIFESNGCSDSLPSTQAIVARSSCPSLDGSFDLHFGEEVVRISVKASASQLENTLRNMHNIDFVEVTAVSPITKNNNGAWVISFSSEKNPDELLAITDKHISGCDASVQVMPVINITTYADYDDMSGDYRIHLCGEISSPLSHRATSGKILQELHRFQGISKAFPLLNRAGVNSASFEALIDDSFLIFSDAAIAIVGDILNDIALGDEVHIGTCQLIISNIKYNIFDELDSAGFIYSSKYNDTETSNAAKRKGYTTIQVKRKKKSKTISFFSDCSSFDSVNAQVTIGERVTSKAALPGRVSISSEIFVINANYGSPCIELSVSNSSSPKLFVSGTQLVIEGNTYTVAERNELCCKNCIRSTSNFIGGSVNDANTNLKVYVTDDIQAFSTESLISFLSVGDTVYLGHDELLVSHVTNRDLILSGVVSSDHTGSRFYVDGNGFEYAFAIEDARCNLDSLRVVPDDNWRGTGSRIQIQRPASKSKNYYILGNIPEVQKIILRGSPDDSSASFTLTFNGFETNTILWPSLDGLRTAIDIKTSVEALPSMRGGITVAVDSYTETQYVFNIRFFGIFENIPQFLSTVPEGSNLESFHFTAVDGIANGAIFPSYVALESSRNYSIRVTAHNGKGLGAPSMVGTGQTAKDGPGGVLPGAPRSIVLGTYYTDSSLQIFYSPPLWDGGSSISKYRIEWDTTPNFSNYKFDEISLRHEVQDLTITCRRQCLGSFTLSWGGRTTEFLSADVSSNDLAISISKLVGTHDTGIPPVKVTKKIIGHGKKWSITFLGVRGNVGNLEPWGHFLVGVDPLISVKELVTGNADIHPGAFTYEVQTVYIKKKIGFNSLPVSGTFKLLFEDKETPTIDVTSSAQVMKESIEQIKSVHTVNVDKFSAGGLNAWVITFTHLNDENRPGAGDIGLFSIKSSSLLPASVSTVEVFENVKGTKPMVYSINECLKGVTHFFRVSAYNPLGWGTMSRVASATPKGQPSIPSNVSASVSSGSSLQISWSNGQNNGDEIGSYELSWFSNSAASIHEKYLSKVKTIKNGEIAEIPVDNVYEIQSFEFFLN